MPELPETGMLKFSKWVDILENYHHLRHSVTNVEPLDSPNTSPVNRLFLTVKIDLQEIF